MGVKPSLIDLPTRTLLDKFGSGKHAPGSGSAAALMGLLAARLLVTVGALTLKRKEYELHHVEIRAACDDMQLHIIPLLLELFQSDAEAFDEVISARRARDKAKGTPERDQLVEVAIEKLKVATHIPFRIADACLRLVKHATLIFDHGFVGARGDSGAGLSSAFAGAKSAVFIVNLNLKAFRGSYWARHQRLRCDLIQGQLKETHSSAIQRVATLRSDDTAAAGADEHKHFAQFEIKVQQKYSDREIQAAVEQLQAVLWNHRETLWAQVPSDDVKVLDPQRALEVLGYSCEIDDTLGTFNSADGAFEIAGLFEANLGHVKLSRQFSQEEQTFTAAHELGHAVLHPYMDGAHRDRPLTGGSRSREPREAEADKFAALFLMPPNILRERFVANFATSKFVLDDDSAFWIAGLRLEEVRSRFRTRREVSRYLASADRYAGRQIVPLAEQFRVSPEALAIRLEELKLFEFP
jgi:formiminotetrahydrofolate cyclodeaminase/Zn-dependent peptidase ImmA (M78 family)